MSRDPRWQDLSVRSLSAAGLIALGLGAVVLGGVAFHLLTAAICALMTWELACMLGPGDGLRPRLLAAGAAASVVVAIHVPPGVALPLLLAPAIAGLALLARGAAVFAVMTALILMSGQGLIALRDEAGLWWVLWLIGVVVATDVAGYFAGRAIGGPKLWPAVSPKKTWSGAIAGWGGAAAIGLLFAGATAAGLGLAGLSIAVSIASQIGDIAESALKRRVGVKDSSALIPGHGGLLDRFDGMLGAAVFLLLAGPLMNLPGGP